MFNSKEYLRKWRKDNPERAKETKRKYEKRNPDKVKLWRYNSRMGGMRIKVLKRDNYECQICGDKEKLNVHHFDENKKNNTYWNLLTLCSTCHKSVHLGYF